MIRPLFLALCLTIAGMAPFQALAASCFASSKASFDVTFMIDQARLYETVMAQQSRGQRQLPLWSDELNTKLYAVIADDHIQRGRNYKVWLKYIHSGNASQKAGMLEYYIWEQGNWKLLQQRWADLSSLKSTKIGIKALGNAVTGFQCQAPQPPELADYCDLFPGPLQTWEGNTNNYHTSDKASTIFNTKEHHIGFSNAIINDLYGSQYKPEDNVFAKCDGEACLLNGKMAANRILTWDTSAAKHIETYKIVHNGENYTPPVGTYFKDSGGVAYGLIVDKGGHVTFNQGEYWFDNLSLIEGGEITIKGKVIIHVRYKIEASAAINTDHDADDLTILAYYMDGHGTSKSCPLPLHGPTRPPEVAQDYTVKLNNAGSIRGRIYSRGPVALSNQTTMRGAVTACQLQLTNQAEIIGDSACFNPPPAKDYFIDVTPEQDFSLTCDRQKVEFQVTDKEGLPAKGYKGEVDIATSLSTPGKAYWYKQESGGTGSRLDASQAHSLAVDDNGHLALWLKSDKIGKVSVTATLADDKDKSDSGLYNFVPFKFVIADEHLPVVAGRPVDIEIKAMACSSPQSNEVASGYQGERTLTLATRYDAPLTGRDSVELAAPKSDDWKTEAIKLDFNQGRAKAQLRYLDAGKTMLTLFDPECTLDGCEILPRSRRASLRDLGNWQRLEGSQAVWSRPYTFALCNAGGEAKPIQSATGTSVKGNAFVAAGEQFETKAKPVIWLPVDAGKSDIDAQGNARGTVDSSQMCGRPITANFMASGSPGTSVELSIPAGEGIQPHSPRVAGASAGQLFVENQSLTNQSLEDTPFSARWSEVGSVLLQADTQADYLGMDMNMGYRPVGRFYPKYFKVVEAQSGTAYPQDQSFVYMDQPFRAMLRVQAQNAQKLPTVNYGYFADKNQLGVEVEAVDTGVDYLLPNRLTDRIDFGGWPKNWGQMWQRDSVIVPDSPLLFGRLLASPAVLAGGRSTAPDGPYEVAMGVLPQEMSASECQQVGCPVLAQPNIEVVACGAGQDCSEPRSAEQFARFATRYGRMVLDDVAGRADSDLTIPLRVEYWNGTEFVTNKDDDVSRFDGQYSCRQILAQSVAIKSQSRIEGKGQVEEGVTGKKHLTAIPDPTRGYREQARFWQKLVDANPKKAVSNDPDIACEKGYAGEQSQPWLLFNWRGLGDENPSAVVTFGAYRGNDRIIYRGEKGINGLLN
ncbi:hypothetical protein ABT56_08965 [Photobacterium aquae]|uniref:DUF6701 domain-containing protein n=1 Tax=Photobacterium aquae TaxID=1195763 RepID=A0A0J1JV46_9GAMM|nr:DUF6701 domain-containing protein [Photobacterium aquae]KLV06167.1 hypothetical protein ABT56_08965 [Photobacterium aquae]